MGLDDINIDFDLGKMIEGFKNAMFKTVRIIFLFFINLPKGAKITLLILFMLFVVGIGILAWKYRYEWQNVKY